MNCPICKQSSRCRKTLNNGDEVIRHRQCIACGKRWSSKEILLQLLADTNSQGLYSDQKEEKKYTPQLLVATNVPAARSKYSEAFEVECWNKYPKHRRINKQGAYAAWLRQKPEVTIFSKGLQRWLTSEDWTKNNGQYVPYPERFIGKRMWEAAPFKAIGNSGSALKLQPRPKSDAELLIEEADRIRKERSNQ